MCWGIPSVESPLPTGYAPRSETMAIVDQPPAQGKPGGQAPAYLKRLTAMPTERSPDSTPHTVTL